MSQMMNYWNSFNKKILKTRLHFLTSKNTLLLTCTGRKSGQPITTPVNYAQDGDVLRFTTIPGRQWWRNLKANPEVTMYLRGEAVHGTAEVFEDPENVAAELGEFLEAFPGHAQYFKVRINKDKSFNAEDLLYAADNRVMIKVRLGE